VSGPASLTQEHREALVESWREACPAASLIEHRKASPAALTSYD
jgi:hypothetical protein